MGLMYEVAQISPHRVPNGAAIPARPESVPRIEDYLLGFSVGCSMFLLELCGYQHSFEHEHQTSNVELWAAIASAQYEMDEERHL